MPALRGRIISAFLHPQPRFSSWHQATAIGGREYGGSKYLIDFWQMGSLTDWQTKAVEFMSRPENIRAVDMLAAHLLKHTTLEAEYMSVLISVADGETTETEFERYLIIRGPVDMASFVEQFQ